MKLTIEQARELRDALSQSILNAANAQAKEVDLGSVLSEAADAALKTLADAIAEAKKNQP